MPDAAVPDYTVLQRGWLSSNNIVFPTGGRTAVVDTGYCAHSSQTLALIAATLRGRKLDCILNTHLHSDHCGGNAALMVSVRPTHIDQADEINYLGAVAQA
jgi:glyoxylase-like metal-dependent hydrolase (beta-lactamase superfamily II)